MSLPSPLSASDEYIRHRDSGIETIKVTAGLHRQVWVSGTNIFVDVHIANKSKKVVKRVELQLERDVLFYKHVSAIQSQLDYSQRNAGSSDNHGEIRQPSKNIRQQRANHSQQGQSQKRLLWLEWYTCSHIRHANL